MRRALILTGILALLTSMAWKIYAESRAPTSLTLEELDHRAERRHQELVIQVETVRRQIWLAQGKRHPP